MDPGCLTVDSAFVFAGPWDVVSIFIVAVTVNVGVSLADSDTEVIFLRFI